MKCVFITVPFCLVALARCLLLLVCWTAALSTNLNHFVYFLRPGTYCNRDLSSGLTIPADNRQDDNDPAHLAVMCYKSQIIVSSPLSHRPLSKYSSCCVADATLAETRLVRDIIKVISGRYLLGYPQQSKGRIGLPKRLLFYWATRLKMFVMPFRSEVPHISG